MKILLSPAKSLDLKTAIPTKAYTQSAFLEKAKILSEVLKKKTPRQLARLMHLSDALSELAYERCQNWQLPFTLQNARQAVYTFKGAVYQALDIYTLPPERQEFIQDKLRILSGLYGLLKPLDLIQPYRLEMGTKLPVGAYPNLYAFWATDLTQALNEDCKQQQECVINLASDEYCKAIKQKQIKTKIIQPVFKDYKNGSLKTISFYAKKARGLMTRFIIENTLEDVEQIKQCNAGGYRFDQNLSDEKQWVFTR